MFRSIVCCLLLVAAVTANAVPEVPNDGSAQILLIDDVSKLNDLKAQGVELIPLDRSLQRGQIRYTLGRRASNDQMVSYNTNKYSWSSPQNVQLKITYPTSGQGAVITYVQIDVNQSSNTGQAYVVSGGIGQRNIIIVVEAYDTYYFNYVSNIYGVY